MTHAFQERLERAGLPWIRFHDLRHGAETIWKAAGVDLRTIMELLGHSSYTTTANIYTHVAPDVKRDAAERMQAALARR